jgi:hypothetical protein
MALFSCVDEGFSVLTPNVISTAQIFCVTPIAKTMDTLTKNVCQLLSLCIKIHMLINRQMRHTDTVFHTFLRIVSQSTLGARP